MEFLGDKSKRGKRTPKIHEGEDRNAGHCRKPVSSATNCCPPAGHLLLRAFLHVRSAPHSPESGMGTSPSSLQNFSNSSADRVNQDTMRVSGLRLANSPRGTRRICELLTGVDSSITSGDARQTPVSFRTHSRAPLSSAFTFQSTSFNRSPFRVMQEEHI